MNMMIRKIIDINSDVGEGFGRFVVADDAALLKAVSSANIACGFHAGDPRTMAAVTKQAVLSGVGIGAHPGFPDLNGFGRRDMNLTSWEITTDTLYQLGALGAFANSAGGRLQHVSPHGRLGNLCAVNREYAAALLEAIIRFDSSLIVLAEPGELAAAAAEKGLKVAVHMFADRAYNEDGTLVSRKEPGAVIHDPAIVVRRCLRMVVEGKVTAITGRDISINGHTICVHGDTANSAELAGKIRTALVEAGIEVRKLEDWM